MNDLRLHGLALAAALSLAVPAVGAPRSLPTARQVLVTYADHLNGPNPPIDCGACSDEEAASFFFDALNFRLDAVRCTPLGADRSFCRFRVTTGSGVSRPDNCNMTFKRRITAGRPEWWPEGVKADIAVPNVRCD